MEVQSDQLLPGMIVAEDVLGKSGKPIVQKETELTEVHIDFIQKFLIDKVSILP